MGFTATYLDLKELFPQVDDRLLKAAALEHPHDINFAIDFIVTEVVSDAPTGRADANTARTGFLSTGDFTVSEVFQYAPSGKDHASAVATEHTLTGAQPMDPISTSGNTARPIRVEDDEDFPDLSHTSKFHVSIESAEDSPSTGYGSFYNSFGTAVTEVATIEDVKNPLEHGQKCMQTSDSFRLVEAPSLLLVDPLGSHVPSQEDFCTISDVGNQAPLKNVNDPVDLDFDEDLLTASQESLSSSAFEQTRQVFNVDFFEELVNETGKSKPILLKAVESLFDLVKEAEIHEKEAESAKEEASVAGTDALHKVEELKNMLGRAKEANDMHAGEVYGEKSILATEARELQGRLFHLSEERDRHLSMIEEMKKDLEARIAAADSVKAAAEQEKFDKEAAAAKALAEQELVMEKVVAESKRLKQQAEENSELHEFLMDRGRDVDMLQGEISLICEDVKSLKERIDKGLSASSSSFMFSRLCSNRASAASSLNSSISRESQTSHSRESTSSVAADEIANMEPATVDECKESEERAADEAVDHTWDDDQWELLKVAPDSDR